MACTHPQIAWIGMADGIHCGMCGAKIEPGAPAPTGRIAPKQEREPEPDKEPKKAAEKPAEKPAEKGGRKSGKSK